jgi:hypothetical protein
MKHELSITALQV